MSDKIYTIDDIKQYLYPVFNKYSVKRAVLYYLICAKINKDGVTIYEE